MLDTDYFRSAIKPTNIKQPLVLSDASANLISQHATSALGEVCTSLPLVVVLSYCDATKSINCVCVQFNKLLMRLCRLAGVCVCVCACTVQT